MNKISVIIPAKVRTPQEADWLRVALASIPAKTPVVIVDDHSLIPWADVAAVVDFGKATVMHLAENKHGLAVARNCAMSQVETPYFYPLDADDYLMPDALKIALAAYPGDGFLYGSTILFNDRQRTTYQARPYDICKLLKAVYWPNGCLQLTESWRKIGGWDESLPLYEDWDYWIRSAKAGIIGHDIPDVLYAYRQNPNGIISALKRSPEMAKRAREMIEAKHPDYFKEDTMCCGKKATVKVNNRNTAPARNIAIPEPVQGMVMLVYAGTGLTRSFYGESGTCYRFGGTSHKFGWVKEEDAAGLLRMKDGGRYLFTVQEPTAPEIEEATKGLVEASNELKSASISFEASVLGVPADKILSTEKAGIIAPVVATAVFEGISDYVTPKNSPDPRPAPLEITIHSLTVEVPAPVVTVKRIPRKKKAK